MWKRELLVDRLRAITLAEFNSKEVNANEVYKSINEEIVEPYTHETRDSKKKERLEKNFPKKYNFKLDKKYFKRRYDVIWKELKSEPISHITEGVLHELLLKQRGSVKAVLKDFERAIMEDISGLSRKDLYRRVLWDLSEKPNELRERIRSITLPIYQNSNIVTNFKKELEAARDGINNDDTYKGKKII